MEFLGRTGLTRLWAHITAKLGEKIDRNEVSNVAFTGSYNDLTDTPDMGAEYTLPVATSETLGGVKPYDKTEDMILPVGVDEDGALWFAKPVYTASDIGAIPSDGRNVQSANLALGAVTTDILADQAVTAEKIAAGVIPDANMTGYAGIRYYDNGKSAFPPVVKTVSHDARCEKVSALMQEAAKDALLASTEGVMAHECALFGTYMTWVENVAGTTADVPSDTGVTVIKGRVYNIGFNSNFPSALPNFPNNTVTVIAQKGDEATNTVTGETFNIQGGVGYQTGIDGKVLCGYVPVYGKLAGLTCTISTSANTITVTSRDTWTLTIDGELGEYDYSRLPSGLTGATLHPSNQVAKMGSTYYRADVVPNNGFVVFSSTDLINWTYIGHATFPAGFDDHSATEACCGEKRNRLYVAVRQAAESACLYLAKMNTDMCTVNSCVALPDCGSKPTFSTAVRMPDNTHALYLATAPADRYGCRVYCIPTDYDTTHIYPVFDLQNVACNYPHILQIGVDPTWLLIAGTNGSQSDKKGVSLVPAAVFPKIVGQVKMPEATENIVQLSDGVRTFGDLYTGSGNQPLTFTGAATATYDGTEAVTINIPSGSSGGTSDAWELIEKYTVTNGDTSHKTVLSKTYKRFYIYMVNVHASANSDFFVLADTESSTYNARKLASVALTSAQYKYSHIEIEKIASARIVSRMSSQGGNLTRNYAYYWDAEIEKMPEEYLYFALKTADVTLAGGTIEIYGMPG